MRSLAEPRRSREKPGRACVEPRRLISISAAVIVGKRNILTKCCLAGNVAKVFRRIE
jgi:hypothetical protein